jgi:hypothetical protein
MWIFTNGINLGASRIIGDAVDTEIKETKAYRSNNSQSNTQLNVVGIMREDHLRYGESIGADGLVFNSFLSPNFFIQLFI